MVEKTVFEGLLERELVNLGVEARRVYHDEIIKAAELDDRIRDFTVENAKKWIKNGNAARYGRDPRVSDFQWRVAEDSVPGFMRIWNYRGLRLEYSIDYENVPRESNQQTADRAIREKEFGAEDVVLTDGSVPLFMLSIDYGWNSEITRVELTLHEKGLQKRYGGELGSERFKRCKRLIVGEESPSICGEIYLLAKWCLNEGKYDVMKVVQGLEALIK